MNLLRQWLWPDVSLRRNSLGAINEAFWVALAVAAYRFAYFLIYYLRDSETGPPLGLLITALFFVGFAVGIHFRSRVAAILAFSLYILDFFYSVLTGRVRIFVLPIVVALALLAGVRGTFAYHKLPAKPDNLPSLADSFRSVKGPVDN